AKHQETTAKQHETEAKQRAIAEAAAKERAEKNWVQAMSLLRGHLQWAEHLRKTEKYKEAIPVYDSARGVVETAVAKLPQKSLYQEQLFDILHDLAFSLQQLNRPSEAADVWLQAVAVARQRLADTPRGVVKIAENLTEVPEPGAMSHV